MPPFCLPQEFVETKESLLSEGLAHFSVQFTQHRHDLSHPAHAAHSVVALESFEGQARQNKTDLEAKFCSQILAKYYSWPHSHHTDRRLGVPWGHVEFVQKTRGSDSGNWCRLAVRAVSGDEFEPGPLDHWITLPEVNSPDLTKSVAHHLRHHQIGPERFTPEPV